MASAELEAKKVFLTGCTGEVGSRLAVNLLDLGFKVYGLRNSNNCRINHPSHSCREVNLLDDQARTGMEEINPDILVHTSWFTNPNEFWDSSKNDEWMTASQKLIKGFAALDGKYVVVTGSCAEYSWDSSEPLNEESLELPSSNYGRAKLDLLNWLRSQNLAFLWTRTFFQFGMNEPEGRLIPSLIDSFNAGREFIVRSGNDVRDFVFIEDVSKILSLLISHEQTGLVNIGNGAQVEVATLSKRIANSFGRPDLLRFENHKDKRSFVVSDPKKLHSIIGNFRWSPLEEALASSIAARKR